MRRPSRTCIKLYSRALLVGAAIKPSTGQWGREAGDKNRRPAGGVVLFSPNPNRPTPPGDTGGYIAKRQTGLWENSGSHETSDKHKN